MSVIHPPEVLVGEHVVRAGDEDVRVGDRGDAVDHVEEADDEQQDGREQDQPVAVAFRAVRVPLDGLVVTDVIAAPMPAIVGTLDTRFPLLTYATDPTSRRPRSGIPPMG